MSDWIEKLKPGDKVIHKFGGIRQISSVVQVDRVTKTQVICSGQRFCKSTGRRVGDSGLFSYCRISEATPEAIEKVTLENERRELLTLLKNHTFEELSLGQLRRIKSIVEGAGQ